MQSLNLSDNVHSVYCIVIPAPRRGVAGGEVSSAFIKGIFASSPTISIFASSPKE